MNDKAILEKILVLNELSNNTGLTYKFSDPDGIRTGKSGYSFGKCQFDLLNNGMAALCLKECGFSPADIQSLKDQTCPSILLMNSRLAAQWKIVDQWDDRQIESIINRVRAMGFDFEDDIAKAMTYDYDNQFFISKGGQFFTWAKSLDGPITADGILDFKMGQTWGKKRPDDVQRRFDNVLQVMA